MWNTGCALAAAVWTAPLAAQLAVPQLHTLFPPGAQVGARVEVVVAGTTLEDVRELRFSGSGIEARPVLEGTNATPVPHKFVVSVATNALPGCYDTWVVGRHGISNLRSFRVGLWPDVVDAPTNSAAAFAQSIAVPGTVFGRATANASDFFRVRASGGGRALVVRCEGSEFDSRIAVAFEVFDAAGAELGRFTGGAAFWRRCMDPQEFVIRVHDFLYRGGEDYPYRLVVHEGPHVDRVFPPVAQAGHEASLQVYGVNLAGAAAAPAATGVEPFDVIRVQVLMPECAAQWAHPRASTTRVLASGFDWVPLRFDDKAAGFGSLDASPILLGLARDPVIADPNAATDQAGLVQLALPSEWVGIFPKRGRAAVAEFEASKGDVIWVEVISHRLGLATDPQLNVSRVVRTAGGGEELKEIKDLQDSEADFGGPEFRSDSRDFRGRIDIAEDGRYRLQLRDLFAGDRVDPRATFRLQVRKARPDFRLAAVVSRPPPANRDQRIAAPWSVVLRRGETLSVRVLAYRQDGFEGPIDLKATGLPPGVVAGATRIEVGKSAGLLLLTAATNAVAWVGSMRIFGEGAVAGAGTERSATVGVVSYRVEDYNNEVVPNRLASELPLAVHVGERAPVRVFPLAAAPVHVRTNSKVVIPMGVEREADFAARLALKAVANGALEKQPELAIEPGTNQLVLEVDLARTPLPPGRHVFALSGEISGKYRPFVPGLVQAREELKAREAELAKVDAADGSERRKEAEGARKAAADRVTELEKQGAPTDAFLRVLSEPVVLEVTPGEAGT